MRATTSKRSLKNTSVKVVVTAEYDGYTEVLTYEPGQLRSLSHVEPQGDVEITFTPKPDQVGSVAYLTRTQPGHKPSPVQAEHRLLYPGD